MQLKTSLDAAIARLTLAKVPSPRLNAETLLLFVLNCDRAYFFAHPERELTSDEHSRYDAALAERSRGVPTQYITGHQEFWGMDFVVTPAVLIPRPETEHVVEAVLDLAARLVPPQASDKQRKLRIIDAGTGSGAIALALAKELPTAEIHAVDISREALEVAHINAARQQLTGRVHFHEADLLTRAAPSTFDFVVSNPPYVGEAEEDEVQLEVRKFEPRIAVFSGPTGLEVIVRLIRQAAPALRPGGWLVMEISGTIAEEVKKLLKGWSDVEVKPDLQSIPRVAIARKPLAEKG